MECSQTREGAEGTKLSALANLSFSIVALPLLPTTNEGEHFSSFSAHLTTHLTNRSIPTRNTTFPWNPLQKCLQVSSLASLASSFPLADLKLRRKISGTHTGKGDQHLLGTNLIAGNERLRKELEYFFRQFGKLGKRSSGKRKEDDVRTQNNATTAIRGTSNKVVATSQHLLAGAISAMVSRTIVAPLERVKLEYLVRGANSDVFKTIRKIFLAEGVQGFWRGNFINLLRTAPFKSINFYTYDVYRIQLLRWGNRTEVSTVDRLAAGAAAGITATILCFPLDTLRTVMVAPGGEALGGLRACFQHVMQTEGVMGLYKGLLPAVVSIAPSGAVFYGVYDILKASYLNSPEGRAIIKKRPSQLELGPCRTLLYGALAGIASETVTYPLEVVRRAQQMQRAANHLSVVGTIQKLLSKGGVGALYAGVLPSTAQVLPSAALSYFVYESVKVVFKIP